MTTKWTGTFSSTAYSFLGITPIHGTIAISLDRDITRVGYDTEYTLTYTGTYKYNTCISGPVTVTEHKMIIYPYPGQTVTFEISYKTSDQIHGSYVSKSPSDNGTFVLNLESK